MKPTKPLLTLLAVVLGIVMSASAFAHGPRHGGRASFGFYFGAPAFWYYPPPYYYYPAPVVVAPSSPPVYVERGSPQPAPEQAESYWYYCPETSTYYPYVKQCPGGWQRVVPHSPTP
jgi:hypothetical protein